MRLVSTDEADARAPHVEARPGSLREVKAGSCLFGVEAKLMQGGVVYQEGIQNLSGIGKFKIVISKSEPKPRKKG